MTIGFYSNTKTFGGSEVYLKDLMIHAACRVRAQLVFFCNLEHPLLRDPDVKTFLDSGSIRTVFINSYLYKKTSDYAGKDSKVSRIKRFSMRKKYRSWVSADVKLFIGTIREVVHFRKMFLKHPVDLLHFNDTGCEPPVIGARLAGLRNVVGTLHVSPSYEPEKTTWVYRLIEYWSVRSLHTGIAVARNIKESWAARTGINGRSIEVIYNGIDGKEIEQKARAFSAAERPFDSSGRMIICIPARLHHSKGQDYLINIIPDVLKECPQTCFVFVGEGPQRTAYEELAKRLNLASSVFFMGFRQDVHRIMAHSDIIVLPSTGLEAFPYVILEAMALSKPVVSTRVGGIPEMIRHGQDGYVVAPADSAALKEALLPLIKNESLRLSMGSEGKKTVNRFSIEAMLKNTLMLYQKMLKKNLEIS